jgi:transketolase
MLPPCRRHRDPKCWQIALEGKNHPTGLALTRQNLVAARTTYSRKSLAKGAYVLHEDANAAVSIFASGSEVEIAVKAKELLAAKGIAARVVSVPAFELLFDAAERRRLQGLRFRQAPRSRSPSKPVSARAGIRSSAMMASSSA